MPIETSGVDEACAALDAIAEAWRQATPAGIDSVMNKMVRQTKVQLSMGQHPPGTKTGSVAPAPPWRISGKLRASVKKTPARALGGDRWQGEAGPSDIVYARIQELGGDTGWRHRTRLPPRPYVAPAWRITRATAAQSMAKYWRNAVKSVLR
jgi:hypothetical protein